MLIAFHNLRSTMHKGNVCIANQSEWHCDEMIRTRIMHHYKSLEPIMQRVHRIQSYSALQVGWHKLGHLYLAA